MGKLPVVCKDVALSALNDVTMGGDKKLEDIIKIVKNENPAISDFLSGAVEMSDDKIATLYAGLGVYYLLRSQAEVDQLNPK